MPIEPNHGPRCLCTCGKSFPSPWPWAKMLMMASPRHLISLPFHITLPLRQIFLWHDSQVIQMVGVNSLSVLYHYSFSLCIILCSHLSFVQLSLLNLLIFFNSNSFFSNWSRSCFFFCLLWRGIKGGYLPLHPFTPFAESEQDRSGIEWVEEAPQIWQPKSSLLRGR